PHSGLKSHARSAVMRQRKCRAGLRFGFIALTCVLATLVGGCASRDEPAPPVSVSGSPQDAREAARLIALPDVSRLAKPVQAQVRERHSALMAKLEDRNTPHVE